MKVHDKEHTGKNLADLAAQVFNKQVDTAVITSIPAQEGSGLVNHSPPPSSKKEALEQKPDPTFEALSNGFQAKDDAIEKHLQPLLQKDTLDYLSFKHAVETGTISGGLRMALHKMLTLYAQSENQRLTEELKQLQETFQIFKEGIARGTELYANLRFDDQEFTPYQVAVQTVERLTKINEELVKACQLYMRIISDEGCIPDMEQIELTDKMQSALKKAKSNP